MLRSLWSAAAGMYAQQLRVDTIANNLANINTPGYKRVRTEFQDLLYQQLAGDAAGVTVEVGNGVRLSATNRIFIQGNLLETGNPLDLALEGDGFFVVNLPQGGRAFTRDGSFKLSSDGRLVTSEGYEVVMDGSGRMPEGTVEISVAADGTVSALVGGSDQPREVGTLRLATFPNPAGLAAIGHNLYRETRASGEARYGASARVVQGYLEAANVELVGEMVALIMAQRAYELNSRSVKAADEMLALANNLRR